MGAGLKRPAFQFYPADWRKDPALSTCSLAARGLWIELMCIAHESDEYGVLSIAGKAMTTQQLARAVGESPAMVMKLLNELSDANVFSRDEKGAIFSRRMVRDEHIRNVRAEAGRLGGNPDLLAKKVKQKDKQNTEQILTPSSSSSSSNTNTPLSPLPGESSDLPQQPEPKPKRQRKAKTSATLEAWLADLKAKGEKALPPSDPIFNYAKDSRLPTEFLRFAWVAFRERNTGADKTQADWRAAFRNAVRGNWLRLWWLNTETDTYELTTAGHQIRIAVDARTATEPEAA